VVLAFVRVCCCSEVRHASTCIAVDADKKAREGKLSRYNIDESTVKLKKNVPRKPLVHVSVTGVERGVIRLTFTISLDQSVGLCDKTTCLFVKTEVLLQIASCIFLGTIGFTKTIYTRFHVFIPTGLQMLSLPPSLPPSLPSFLPPFPLSVTSCVPCL
jgi:hypothetical protein